MLARVCAMVRVDARAPDYGTDLGDLRRFQLAGNFVSYVEVDDLEASFSGTGRKLWVVDLSGFGHVA